ncbi:hypothetical protein AVEN_218627-1 [Araneus ventricosus]|uniref:Uncharacterized protein n=1 Tax=Araneus ventricosus TaxID=182803 RepID=A0A4Y2JUG7_ARAVE|nr:hypothetical protein AVEN_218627-1 [Araneus ventricosus]
MLRGTRLCAVTVAAAGRYTDRMQLKRKELPKEPIQKKKGNKTLNSNDSLSYVFFFTSSCWKLHLPVVVEIEKLDKAFLAKKAKYGQILGSKTLPIGVYSGSAVPRSPKSDPLSTMIPDGVPSSSDSLAVPDVNPNVNVCSRRRSRYGRLLKPSALLDSFI